MIRVIVQHHLTEEGQAKFADWVTDVRRRASSYAGYIDVCQVKDIRHPQRTIIQLEWEDEASLNYWRDSQDHHDVIAASAEHRTEPMQAYFLAV